MIAHYLIIFSLAFGASLRAQNSESRLYAAQSQSLLWIEGSSNMNQFRFKTSQIRGTGYLDTPPAEAGRSLADSSQRARIKVRVSIPVRSLDGGNKLMNQDMYEALKAEVAESIQYELLEARLIERADSPQGWFQIEAIGTLMIAGKIDTIAMNIKLRQLADGRLHLKGQKLLRMTAFGVTPPSALRGLIKANNEIVIHFDLIAAMEKRTMNPSERF